MMNLYKDNSCNFDLWKAFDVTQYLWVREKTKRYLKVKSNNFSLFSELQTAKMTMWADNIKFVKDILDGKYKKIDDAVAEVKRKN